MNHFSSRGDGILEMIGESAGSILASDYASFGIDKELGESVLSLSENFHDLLGSAKSAADASKQATSLKDGGRAALLGILAQVSAAVYSPTSTVTNAQLASIGFAPRRAGSVQPKVAQRVTGLTVTPDAAGSTARLVWTRGLNPKSALFQVFASLDSGASWEMVGATNRVRLELPATPGTTAWYRIVATTAKATAAPSASAAIYGPSPESEFRLKVA